MCCFMAQPGFFPPEPPPPQPKIKKQPVDSEAFAKLAKGVGSVSANLRILEERYSNLRNRLQSSEQGVIRLDKNLKDDIRSLSEEVIDVKKEVSDMKDKLMIISSEIKKLVHKNDFRVVERYLDMWQPMGFVTRSELDKILALKKGEKSVLKPEKQ